MKSEMWVAFIVEALVQFFLAWSNVFNTLLAGNGMLPEIIVAYRYSFGLATLLLLVFISILGRRIFHFFFSTPSDSRLYACLLQREEYCPHIKWKDLIILVGQAFLCGFLGSSFPQNLNVNSLSYLNPNWASMMSTCNPLIVSSITLPIVFRKELSALRRGEQSEKLKLLGVIIMGWFVWAAAMYLELCFQGNILLQRSSLTKAVPSPPPPSPPSYTKNINGVIMSIIASVSTALSLILQAKMYEKLPSNNFFIITLVNSMGAIQATVYALCKKHDKESWKLDLNINLLAVTYLGVVCSGIMMGLTAFCMRCIGREVVSGFNPVMLILSTGPLIISNGNLRLGSVLSGLLMICGWSAIIWATIKEQAHQFTDTQQETNGSTPCNIDVELVIDIPDEETKKVVKGININDHNKKCQSGFER